MIVFLARRPFQEFAGGARARHCGLAAVQPLRGDLAGMIDPHQAGGVPPFALREVAGVGGQFGRSQAAGRRKQGAQGLIRDIEH